MTKIHQYWVYIMSNYTRTVLYIGVTNDMYRRFCEHKYGIIKGFTQKYNCNRLVYYEEYNNINDAIAREKKLKGWKREKKETLIAKTNPQKANLAKVLKWEE